MSAARLPLAVAHPRAGPAEAVDGAPVSALLSVRGLLKRYRGVTATDHVDLDVQHGELQALIGPNGAGKTTLINLLSGELRPDAGRIVFGGHDVTALPIASRAREGLVRSYQITSVFPEFTALQNVMLAVQAHSGRHAALWADVRRDRRLLEPARVALADVGLAAHEQRPVATMAHGARRQLELAMVLALQPRLMLLDEPLAGISGAEADAMVELLRRLKARTTILLVEHDMDAVFSLADRITALVNGRPIASGTPDAIRRSAEVRAAYLGDDEEALA